ncbi:MAG: gliding motility-associated C-terminal domain-containing protein [Bacteroidales bacterium]|nr:gliding motility-associated C-terminal domain-containing protein [Bacteroidales bacterium]
MKLAFRFLILLLLSFCTIEVMAQTSAATYHLTSALNGTTITSPSQGLFLTDDDALEGGQYAPGTNFSVTIANENPCPAPNRFCLEFTDFDIAPEDTIYFYDGPNTASPLLLKANNSYNPLTSGRKVFVSPTNETNTITVRFRVGTSVSGHTGFVLRTECDKPCGTVVPRIDSVFYRVRNGAIYDTARITVETLEDGSTINCINLCKGDELILNAHGIYTNYYGYYKGNDTTSTFVWDMGIDRSAPDGPDTIRRVGAYQLPTNFFADTIGCYGIILSMVDSYGCASTMADEVRIRIAQSPIKTIISELPLFCSNDSLRIIIGVEEMRAHLVLDTMHRAQIVSRTNNARTFIPDGPNCERVLGSRCYSAPVTFTEFPNGKTVQAKEDICSICINYEHTYMGDYSLAIICPSGQSAELKSFSDGGGGIHTGYPYGGSRSDIALSYDNGCDSAHNMYGIGLDYCFSRNGDYTLVDGNPADIASNGSHFIHNGNHQISVTVDFPPRHAAYRNSGSMDAGRRTFTTKRPSDHENKLNYYKPRSNFQSLVGCPLNGTWSIQLCDQYGADNGWVFSWSLDICNTLDKRDCKYDVKIDSVAWKIDSSSGSIRNGKYYGPVLHKHSDSISYALMVDTAGYDFPVNVSVYDAFGCEWTAQTKLQSIWAPKLDLGGKRYVCKDATVQLTANDRHTNPFYTYEWLPNGEQTQTITSMPGGDAQSYVTYTVTANNNESTLIENCSSSDSVIVEVKYQPLPNFDASIYPMEGCEPLHETISNHSQYVDHHYWDFGDGHTSTEAEPSHTYAAGVYDIKYYVSNDNGCQDSLILPGIVNVYTTPDANFTWEPAYPTVRNPFINIINFSEPDNDEMQYFWEYQYDKDNPYSFQTYEGEREPQLTWSLGDKTDGGYYTVRLVALTEHQAPSGKIYRCTDTTETKVLMVNDFLQFPNLITANGDGNNDRFVIKNLVGGLGYPNNRLDIYNRWGGRVFHAENIDSDDDFWDPAEGGYPSGTYFWYFYARGFMGVIERRGVVEVVR